LLDDEKLKKEMNGAIEWISNYVNESGAKGIAIGLSGGKDSATVLAMAVKAIGKENVVAVSMPCNSIASDFDDAKECADKFGVKFIKVDLSSAYGELEKSINEQIGKVGAQELSREAKINIKPRMRMATVYSIAQSLGYLVIGTGNLCEAMVGYTTKWGDSASDFNPIANFTVAEVLRIGEFLGVPDVIIKKAPNDGLGGQTDEEKLGVKYAQIAEMVEKGNIEDEKAKEIILKKFASSKHKRQQVPTYKFDRKNYLLDM
jgi:NAD+ synthase